MKDELTALSKSAEHFGDALSLGVVIMTLVDWLPSVTALGSFIWLCFRFYETWLGVQIKRRELKNLDK